MNSIALSDRDAANVASVRFRGTTTPTEKRLRAANDNRRLEALAAYRAAMDPMSSVTEIEATDSARMGIGKPTPGDGWRMRPSVGELIAATSGRVCVRSAAGRTHAERSKGGTVHIGPLVFTLHRYFERGPVLVAGEVATGNVMVPRYAMIERGTTERGRTLRPSEYRTHQQSTSQIPISDPAAYIAMPPARPESVPHMRAPIVPLSGSPRQIGRTSRAEAASAELESAWANTDTSNIRWGFCAPGVAASYGQIAGLSNLRGNTTAHGPACRQAQSEMARAHMRRALDVNLSISERAVLELAAGNDNAEKAGSQLGMTRKQFCRTADAALDRVREIIAA